MLYLLYFAFSFLVMFTSFFRRASVVGWILLTLFLVGNLLFFRIGFEELIPMSTTNLDYFSAAWILGVVSGGLSGAVLRERCCSC